MSEHAEQDPGYTVTSYFELLECGVLAEGDRVELLEGLIVASPQQGPNHSSVLMRVTKVLMKAAGDRASVRGQMPFIAGPRSAPEPDLALVPGDETDYLKRHPDQALLVIEISDSSLPQDRLTKSRIYARAAVPEYWIVNLRERCVEVRTRPDTENRVYSSMRIASPGETIELTTLRGVVVSVAELFPGY